jgi:hypothetical protein
VIFRNKAILKNKKTRKGGFLRVLAFNGTGFFMGALKSKAS